MQIADLTNPNTNPLPDEVKELVAALLEGRVHSLAILAEITDHEGDRDWLTCYSMDMDDNETDEIGFVGAMTMLQRQIIEAIDPTEIRIIQISKPDDNEDDVDD